MAKNHALRRHRTKTPPVAIEGTEFNGGNRASRRHITTVTGKVIHLTDPRSYMRMLPGRF